MCVCVFYITVFKTPQQKQYAIFKFKSQQTNELKPLCSALSLPVVVTVIAIVVVVVVVDIVLSTVIVSVATVSETH